MENKSNKYIEDNSSNIREEIERYLIFWPYFLISFIIMIMASYTYLRYANYMFESVAKIQIIDKGQDSEMALPTAMTIFNRSMVNLENEIGVLSSFSLHKRVVEELSSNIKYYTVGNIKTSQDHQYDWFDDYVLNFKIDTDNNNIFKSYLISIIDNNLTIVDDINGKEISFNGLSTTNINHSLPFDLIINQDRIEDCKKILNIYPVKSVINSFVRNVNIFATAKTSDQLYIKLMHRNRKISDEYLNVLMDEFDKDGIVDRQLSYQRTMDFVDSRSIFLLKELDQIENKKKEFKEKNNLTDIRADASLNATQKYNYNSELFKSESQKNLAFLLKESLLENNFKLIPVNIGIDNLDINRIINEYNIVIKERDRYLTSAGPNNPFIKRIDKQLNDYYKSIIQSIQNYEASLEVTIESLKSKENEFSNLYQNIPENEKILRSIERELEIKESLFLLLLQKREEAAINFAVVDPSIKIIDNAISNNSPVSPNSSLIYIVSILIAFGIPISILYLWFLFDTRIHTRTQLLKLVNNRLPIIGEVPHIHDKELVNKIVETNSRFPIAESIRMIIANLNFILFDKTSSDKSRNNLILVTSSVKGEGKTVISTNIAAILKSKFNKVLLVGADLRNPQIHKFIGVKKEIKGLSDYIYTDTDDWSKYLIKHNELDIILSGTIPPNPTELLSSRKFENFLNEASKKYDYIVIDSAPCLLVSDTFEISKHVDTTVYVVRSNFSQQKLSDFINECTERERLSNICLVLNSVGASTAYGYKYGYQYGYKYGYKYGYNYGYGYGYSDDNK